MARSSLLALLLLSLLSAALLLSGSAWAQEAEAATYAGAVDGFCLLQSKQAVPYHLFFLRTLPTEPRAASTPTRAAPAGTSLHPRRSTSQAGSDKTLNKPIKNSGSIRRGAGSGGGGDAKDIKQPRRVPAPASPGQARQVCPADRGFRDICRRPRWRGRGQD